MTLTPEEGRRVHVLTLLEGKRIGVGQAADALGLSPRQVRRLRVRLREAGPAALIHGNRGRRSDRRLPEALTTQVLALARGRYAGLNDVHLTEKLTTVEGLAVSRATVQRVLRAAGLSSPRRRRPPRHRSRRPRQPQVGLRCQLDGSPFAWFSPTEPACSLLAAIDDATGTVLAATFRAQEDTAGYLTLLHGFFESELFFFDLREAAPGDMTSPFGFIQIHRLTSLVCPSAPEGPLYQTLDAGTISHG